MANPLVRNSELHVAAVIYRQIYSISPRPATTEEVQKWASRSTDAFSKLVFVAKLLSIAEDEDCKEFLTGCRCVLDEGNLKLFLGWVAFNWLFERAESLDRQDMDNSIEGQR
jgi:hypothetical protein